MSKEIKRVTMNGVEVRYSAGVWWHNGELVFENARDFDRFAAAGLITVEYEPDPVKAGEEHGVDLPKCEHGELHTLPCWKCEMLAACRDGELELMSVGGWWSWIDLMGENTQPTFVNPKECYRRRPKLVAPKEEIVEFQIKVGDHNHGTLLAVLNGMLGCQVMAAQKVNDYASFRGYKFADGVVRMHLWRVKNDADGKQQFIHAVAVLLAKEANGIEQPRN